MPYRHRPPLVGRRWKLASRSSLGSGGPFLPLERLGWVMRDWLEWFGWVLFLIAVVFLFVWIVYLVGGTRNLPPGQVRSAAGQAAVCLAPTTDL
jgi:hypothetical protein